MKNLFIILLLLSNHFAFAQLSINSSYTKTDVGHQIRFGAEYPLNKRFNIEAGSKYLTFKEITDINNYAFKNRFKPLSTSEHLGLYIGVKWIFYNKNPYVKPFISYDLNMTKSSRVVVDFYDGPKVYKDSIHGTYTPYKRIDDTFKPTTAIEHFVTLGVDVKLTNHFFLTERIGIGVATFYHLEYRENGGRNAWELATLFSSGIKYQFKK